MLVTRTSQTQGPKCLVHQGPKCWSTKDLEIDATGNVQTLWDSTEMDLPQTFNEVANDCHEMCRSLRSQRNAPFNEKITRRREEPICVRVAKTGTSTAAEINRPFSSNLAVGL